MADQAFVLRRSRSIACAASLISDRDYEPIICPAVPGHRSSRRLPGPVTIDLDESDSAECLWTMLGDCLMGAHVIEELRSNGCERFEEGLVKASGQSQIGTVYRQFRATGWGGVAPPESGVALQYRCEFCGHLRYSPLTHPERLFDRTQWDGSDIFMIWPLPMFIFVSPRAAKILQDLEVLGVDVIPITALRVGDSGFSPGRLSSWLPQRRADELGLQLGIA